MIRRAKFFKLNLKQQLYKLANAVRNCENAVKTHQTLDLSEILHYLDLFEEEKTVHPKRDRAVYRVQELLKELSLSEGQRSEIVSLNFCYHDLLELIGEPIGEKFFSVHRFDSDEPLCRFPVVAILDNIRSPFNVGSMFRSADCFGIGELALCGITLTPESLKVRRTAMGTTDVITWRHFEKTTSAIAYYRSQGYRILALETTADSVDLNEIQDFENTVFIFGNEEFGIPEEHLAECDSVVRIPLVGIKNSLNVANTFAVVGYKILENLIKH